MDRRRRAGAALAAALLCALAPAAAQATTFTVTTTADTLPGTPCAVTCSLRAAVEASNTFGGADAIVVPAGRFLLTGGPLDVQKPTTLTGAGARSTIIDAGGLSRVLEVTTGSGSLTAAGLTLTGGRADAGAALRVDTGADASLASAAVRGNATSSSGGGDREGAISVGGSLALRAVTVSGNSATATSPQAVAQGAGIRVDATGALIADLTTIAGNVARASGGGAGAEAAGGGLWSAGTTTLRHVTLADNSAVGTGEGTARGGNLHREDGTLTIADAILTRGTPSGCSAADGVPVLADGPSLDGDGTCELPAGPLTDVDAGVGALADSGGPVDTVVPRAGSPAVDAAGTCPDDGVDARAQRAPTGLGCDLGAAEAGADLVTTIAASRSQLAPGADIAFAVRVENRGLDAAPAVTLALSPSAGAELVTVAASAGTCAGGATIACPLGPLARGAGALVLVVLRAPQAGSADLAAAVTGGLADPAPETGGASATVPVISPPDLLAPQLTGLRLAVKPSARRAGRLAVRLSEDATVDVVVEQLVPGRRRGSSCRTDLSAGRRCSIVREVSSSSRRTAAGDLRLALPRRLGRGSLRRGTFRVRVGATDAAGNDAVSVTRSFSLGAAPRAPSAAP
jgi:CSLREA domain-containing protein